MAKKRKIDDFSQESVNQSLSREDEEYAERLEQYWKNQESEPHPFEPRGKYFSERTEVTQYAESTLNEIKNAFNWTFAV